ncbi:MAG: PHP domain-containing protein, partial [bacterium]
VFGKDIDEDIDYVNSRLHFGRFYYLDEKFRQYPVYLNDGELQLIYQSRDEFKRMVEDNTIFRDKALEICLLQVLKFAHLPEAPRSLLAGKNVVGQELGADVILQYINTEKFTTYENEMAVDFHLHTIYSHDSVSDIEILLKKAEAKGLGAIAVTDHNHLNAIKEVLDIVARLKKEGEINPDFIVIPGEEISTAEGAHIGALFIKYYIIQGMTAEETIREIHRQGGVAVAFHPGANEELGIKLAQTLDFDAVEVGNGSDFLPYDFYRDLKLKDDPQLESKAKFVTSNSHTSQGVAWLGYTAVQVKEKTPQGIKEAIKKGRTRPIFAGIYHPYKRFFELESVDFIYSMLDTYDRFKRRVELLVGRAIFSDDFRIESTWDKSLHDVFNLIGIYKYHKEDDNPLRRRVKLASLSATYGMVKVEYDFIDKKTNGLVKFMF